MKKEQDMRQEERIDQLAKDFLEPFLAGKAALVIEPLSPDDSVASQLGQLTVVHGFTVRLRKD